MECINILLPGAGGFAAINAIKSLKKANFKGKIITTDSNPLSAGFYLADRFHILPKADDNTFIKEAINLIKEESINLIFPTSGFDIIPYSKHRLKLENIGVTCFFSDHHVIEICNDKYKFYNFIKTKFPVPKFTLLGDAEIEEYPLFIKPRMGKGSRNTFVCYKKDELKKNVKNNDDFIISEYLPGKEYTIDVLSDMSGTAICAVPRERIETKAGISFKGKVIHDSFIQRSCMDLANHLGLKGPTCIQMKEDKNGELKFIEVNPRMGGGTIMATLAGVNIPYLLLKLYKGESILESDIMFDEIVVLRYYEEIVLKDGELL